jgi:hypothetical protein
LSSPSSLSVLYLGLPRLAKSDHKVTSPIDTSYNCIAWAACDNSQWWEPDEWGINYWPARAPRKYTLKAYESAYRTLGFRSCDNSEPELGFEKIAVFADRTGAPTHAARQLSNGRWASKCGQHVDIEHDLEAIGGGSYGEVVLFMRRRS